MPKDVKFDQTRPLADVEQPMDLPLASPTEGSLPVPIPPKPKLDPRRALPIEVTFESASRQRRAIRKDLLTLC
jgi:hypothetical protein